MVDGKWRMGRRRQMKAQHSKARSVHHESAFAEATADKWMRMHANGEPFDPDLGVGVSFARFDFAHRKQGKTQIAAEVGARH
jgi:hypothetical protein